MITRHPSLWLASFAVILGLALTACQLQPTAQAVPTLAPTAAVASPSDMTSTSPDILVLGPPDMATEPAPTLEPTLTPEPPTPEPTATHTPEPTPTPSGPGAYTYRVVATYPHDTGAWTQGLDIDRGALFEGTGGWGDSSLREVALETGSVLRSVALEETYFGEGITVLGDRIYQLTWQENTGFVYDRNTFERLQTFTYPTEGWGITHDGERLIMSDGTSTIYFWDPATLAEIGRLEVYDANGPVIRLNELEYINGEIWANIWLEDRIARIAPDTGEVIGWIDMRGLLDQTELTQPADVLNGIAYNEETGQIYVTGKLWPALFEIEVFPAP